jgi:hypothetical protein
MEMKKVLPFDLKVRPHLEKENDSFFSWWLIISWLVVGLVVAVCGFLNLLWLPLFGLLVFPVYFLFFEWRSIFAEGWKNNRVLASIVLAILAIHFTGVLVPETGFDAVWYHLPVLDFFKEIGGISYKANLYQTANPLLSDLVFYPGFQILGEFGAKVTAYLLGVSLLVVVYRLARFVLSERWSWLVLISVLLIQPVTWQFSSFYVDIAKAFWEVSLLWILSEFKDSKRALYVVGILAGATVATKAFSILLIPTILLMIMLVLQKEKTQKIFLFGLGLVTISTLFYVYIWISTGSAFASVNIHLNKLGEIGGQSNLYSYLFQRISSLPISLWNLLISADYVSITIPFLLPFLLIMTPTLIQRKPVLFLQFSLFAATQWMVWWFVPPTSTRYAISGFVILVVLLFWAAEQFSKHKKQWQLSFFFIIGIAVLWHVAPRLVVAQRNLNYLFRNQTRKEYLHQFYDGSVDQHLDSWQQKR